MERCVAIHLDRPADKFSLVGVMLKKLFTLVQKKCVVEGADSLMMHEIVLGGHLYLQLLKVFFSRYSVKCQQGAHPDLLCLNVPDPDLHF